jgi:hypothetical protein
MDREPKEFGKRNPGRRLFKKYNDDVFEDAIEVDLNQVEESSSRNSIEDISDEEYKPQSK